jgi:hypothetical protein
MSKLTEKQLAKMIADIEANPYHKKYLKTGKPLCYTCGKVYKEVKPHLWRGDCSHIPKNLLLAVG